MTIENVRITSTSISMADHGVLCISFGVRGDGWGCSIGQYMNGVGHLGAKEWKGNGSAIVAMMKIMDTVGVTKWEDLPGKFIRVKTNGWGSTIDEIGNIIEDKWFNLREFYATDKGQATFVLDERPPEEDYDDEDDEQVPTSGVNSIPR